MPPAVSMASCRENGEVDKFPALWKLIRKFIGATVLFINTKKLQQQHNEIVRTVCKVIFFFTVIKYTSKLSPSFKYKSMPGYLIILWKHKGCP